MKARPGGLASVGAKDFVDFETFRFWIPPATADLFKAVSDDAKADSALKFGNKAKANSKAASTSKVLSEAMSMFI